MSSKTYEQESARLSKLPRAERFEELLEFPLRHELTVIGRREGLESSVNDALRDLGHQHVLFVERASAKGRFISLRFRVEVQSGVELDKLYTVIEALDSTRYVF